MSVARKDIWSSAYFAYYLTIELCMNYCSTTKRSNKTSDSLLLLLQSHLCSDIYQNIYSRILPLYGVKLRCNSWNISSKARWTCEAVSWISSYKRIFLAPLPAFWSFLKKKTTTHKTLWTSNEEVKQSLKCIICELKMNPTFFPPFSLHFLFWLHRGLVLIHELKHYLVL